MFDDTNREKLYLFGRLLHCVVRAAANKTEPNIPRVIFLADYEEAVFSGKFPEPCQLNHTEAEVASYFRKRTLLIASDVRKKFLNRDGADSQFEEDKEPSVSHQYPPRNEPILLDSAPGQYLYEVYNMEESAFRLTFQVYLLLRVSGIASTRDEAYDLMVDKKWPVIYNRQKEPQEVPHRPTLRTHVKRGKGYLIEQGATERREQLSELTKLIFRDGVATGAQYVFKDVEERRRFLKEFASEEVKQP